MKPHLLWRTVGAIAVCAAVLVLAHAAARGALADDTSLGATGGTVRPIHPAHIRLDAETVQAVCFGRFAQYRVDFRFVNEGPARAVKLGFPFTQPIDEEKRSERPVGFEAWQGRRPLRVLAVPSAYKRGRMVAGYYLHQAVFKHGVTMITVSYVAQASGSAVGRLKGQQTGGSSAAWYDYWLHTGSTWAGPIGRATVRYTLADSFRGSGIELSRAAASEYAPVTRPRSWTNPAPRTYQWVFTDFDPVQRKKTDWWRPTSGYDVTLGFGQPWSRVSLRPRWTWSSAAHSRGMGTMAGIQDRDLSTFWADGAPGDGRGQWVKAAFRRPVHLRELRILPGNDSSFSSFGEFARPRAVTALFSDGTSKRLTFRDSPALQRFPVDDRTRWVRLVVDSVYKGSEFPAVCISEVEFGLRRAPGYVPFARLDADPNAVGGLPAWAGPPAPAPGKRAGVIDQLDDYEMQAGGDLAGLDTYQAAGDDAPYQEASSVAALRAGAADVRLPDHQSAGPVSSVTALSYSRYVVAFSSGLRLAVETRPHGARRTLAEELKLETDDLKDCGMTYSDGRTRPFTLLRLGGTRIALARPGRLTGDAGDCVPASGAVPGQLFWRDGPLTYHLYAPSGWTGTDRLLAAARSIILGPAPPAASGPSVWERLLLIAAVTCAAAASAAALALLHRRRRTRSAAA